jgi:CTP:molybdopterin cytidylyltransferase MocA
MFDELLQPSLPEGARSVIHRHERDVVEVDVGDARVLWDIDTPSDYRDLQNHPQ